MITFVLPAYNEEKNLPVLLDKITQAMGEGKLHYRVVAVNDGSKDRTPEILQEKQKSLPLEVVNHPVNLGLHETIKDGLAYAVKTSEPDDVIITMDADNTHEPSHSLPMIQKIQAGWDIVIASRYQPGGKEVGLSFKRHLLSRGVNIMLALLFPMPGVKDYTCGYRAFRASVLQKLFDVYQEQLVESKTFSATAEILLKARVLQPKTGEVPLVLRYDQKVGSSKMKVWATIFDYLKMMFRMPRRVTRV